MKRNREFKNENRLRVGTRRSPLNYSLSLFCLLFLLFFSNTLSLIFPFSLQIDSRFTVPVLHKIGRLADGWTMRFVSGTA